MTAQLGSVFHAAGPDGAVLAPSVIGRWLGGDQPAVRLGEVLGEGLVHRVGLQERLGVALGRAGVADDVEDGRRVGDVERRAGSAEDPEDVLALVGDERVDVHERPHVTAAGPGVRDDEAAVGVADEDDGPLVRWARNEATYSASDATPCSRFGGARTVKPWPCRSVATAFQLDASAHAPWTRTIVGFGICATYSVTARCRPNRSQARSRSTGRGPCGRPAGAGCAGSTCSAATCCSSPRTAPSLRTHVDDVAAALRPRRGGGAVIGVRRGFALEDAGRVGDAPARALERGRDPDERGRLRSRRAVPLRHDGLRPAARRGVPVPARCGPLGHARPRGRDDLQRAGVEPGRHAGLLRRHADARDLRLRLRQRRRAARPAAVRLGRRRCPTGSRSTPTAACGSRCTTAARCSTSVRTACRARRCASPRAA